ncbi:Ger(x)C family spore germination protein [Paenibacillus sp. LHD-117]|uniref:Ger(x)C family spore germination protein n=1 Tax=Paenibacillus sp. LHD-117 TaxID=3071412 RepID=UPI0027E1288F|nr:Ger(x)C family spore germination protein [Paenibacillus sp. LHD-117]MDQ6420806.1 Ger(x)C family spore germination protein [Paenibacillus sp. LHD-117]
MRTAKTLLLFIASGLLLAGCWNRVELNEIAIITATGVDLRDGKWVISYQTVIPRAISSQGGGSGAAAVNVFSSEADSYRSAISKASQETSRRLYFSHNQIVIIGQEAARKGLGQLLEVYLRNHDSRETVSVFLSKGNARRMLEQLTPLEQIPGAAIHRMIENEDKNNASFRQMTINNVLMDLLSSTKTTGIPGLTMAGTGGSADNVRTLGQTSTPTKVRLSNLGLIVEDKLVGWVSDEESGGINWIGDYIDRTTIGFACSDRKEGKKDSSVRVIRTATDRKPVYADGKWRFDVVIDAEGRLMEYNCKGDLSKPDEVKRIELRIGEEIHAIAVEGWKAMIKHKADVAGFGNLIHKNHPKMWKKEQVNWREHFSESELNVKVNFSLSDTGSSGNNFKQLQEDAAK